MTGIQCADCGRFCGEADFALGLCDYTPDSEFTHERIEWTCRRCAQVDRSPKGQDPAEGLGRNDESEVAKPCAQGGAA